ncbi:hypothetical protein EQG49_04440 [Periweissella cryptocerci]|uniref:Uncharacterized protein n=1 Tax=Periweissella cryptocerci TaxID=2506420 RepID=A0A4P6YT05_9LACO|nr:hypothetical protein [Periweissella cryptocerci]QBO35763.1 hypothetical protein EQG49_04440 [Periweissella cryptocerci]
MKILKTLKLNKYADSSKYQAVGDDIYKRFEDESDNNYRVAIAYELELGDSDQYPFERMQDEYGVPVTEFIKDDDGYHEVEFSGSLQELQRFITLVGKRIYEFPMVDETCGLVLDLRVDEINS